MESAPVAGVEMRKETVAPSEAPCFFKERAAGITPQEQSGKGIPKIAALTTDLMFRLPKYLITFSSGKKA